MNANRIIGLLIVLALSIVFLWASQNYEIAERDISSGYKGEASTNSYYAARQFLRGMGYDARLLSTLDLHKQGYGEQTTLVYMGSRLALGEERSKQLLAWAERGGHLLIRPDNQKYVDEDDENLDLILDPLEISSYHYHDDEDEDEESEATIDALGEIVVEEMEDFTEPLESSDSMAIEELEPDDFEPLEINGISINIERPYQDQGSYLIGSLAQDSIATNYYGVQWLSRAYGKGHISVLNDFSYFVNYNLDRYDHAMLLTLIAGRHSEHRGVIWLLHDTSMPSLKALIIDKALPVVVITAFTFVIWLFGSLLRFGPIIREPEPSQRQLLEHIDAAGYHLWKHSPSKLFARTQQALHERLGNLYPQWQTLEYAGKQSLLTDTIGLSEVVSKLVLAKPKNLQKHEFFSAIKTLETVRKKL